MRQETCPHSCQITSSVGRGRKRHGYQRMRGGRARWQIENATCKTLKNQGENLESNDGHGEQHLSVVVATRMTLAFWVDHTQQRCGALVQAVWAQWGGTRL